VGIVLGLATGGMLVSSVDLATGGMPVSPVNFGYRCDACELVALGYNWEPRCSFMFSSCLSLGDFLCK
jgi:hypothetical protein